MNHKLKEVGSRVQQARKKLKLSQAELAEMVQISTSHLSDIENGKTNIGLDIFISLTEALQVSADWLLQTNVPQVNTIQNQEASEILADCTSQEIQAILRMMRELKNTLKNIEK